MIYSVTLKMTALYICMQDPKLIFTLSVYVFVFDSVRSSAGKIIL